MGTEPGTRHWAATPDSRCRPVFSDDNGYLRYVPQIYGIEITPYLVLGGLQYYFEASGALGCFRQAPN
jgi:hypothetical protein